MDRIVHLDLKGSPFKLNYLSSVFKCIKSWGATGVLLEWEDTFPYTSELAIIGSQKGSNGSGGDGLYSANDVQNILSLAKTNELEPVQLIQTIGHMEFVLKHSVFQHLREEPRSPAVLCPTKSESLQLVQAMLNQTLDAQPDAKFIHIGADEVWYTAICEECRKKSACSEHKTASLFLDHIQNVVLFIKQKRPNLTVLMWEDMLRSMSIQTLTSYKIGDWIQPVLWQYNPIEYFHIDQELWGKYKQVFPVVWTGSAFKGANGACQVLSPVYRYVSNNQAWLKEMKDKSSAINFSGIILTGWSRYDHYATMCELLPVSLPSLKNCLSVFTDPESSSETPISEVLPEDEWPGLELARCVHSFVILKERCLAFLHGDIVSTWLNPWQIKNEYTNPLQVEGVVFRGKNLLTELLALEGQTSTNLLAITGKRSAEEWVGSFITPLVQRLTELLHVAEARVSANASVQPLNVDCDME